MTELVTRQIPRYGWRPDLPDPRDRIYSMEHPTLSQSSPKLPTVFSLRDKMPKVFDQGQLGSCTGNGIVGALMAEGMLQGEAELMLSRLFVYYYEREIEGTVSEDSGAQIRDGIKVVNALGCPPESDWPYDIARFAEKPPAAASSDGLKHRAVEYFRVLPGVPGSPIRTPVLSGRAVVSGFTVFENFGTFDAKTEYLKLPDPNREQILGGHCTDIIGWDFSLKHFPVNVFEVRNSWGAGWGDSGYYFADARIYYEPQRQLSSDLWVIKRAS